MIKERLQQNNHFLLKQTKNYFVCMFFGFFGLDDPQKPKMYDREKIFVLIC